MSRIVVFANAWGPRRGGINAFNTDLCIGLKEAVGEDTEVVCVLVGPTGADTEVFFKWENEASANSIRLAALLCPTEREEPSEEQLDDLKRRDIAADLYVGHDLFTGIWAIKMAKRLGRRSVVLNHMAPFYYKVPKGARGDEVLEGQTSKHIVMFTQADFVAPVGPRLYGYARALLDDDKGSKFIELTPGLPDIRIAGTNPLAFCGITVGRIGTADDVIKQGRLAAIAFGTAVANLGTRLDGFDLAFQAFGFSSDSCTYVQEDDSLKKEIVRRAKRTLSFHGHKFNEDRSVVYNELRRHNVFYMLSLHEGFGLAGFEAIAAGVPLMLSDKSGLHNFLSANELDGHVTKVSLHGEDLESSLERDLEQIVAKTEEMFNERTNLRTRALELRKKLQELDVSWRNCACQLLEGCGRSDLIVGRSAPKPKPNPIQRSTTWPWRGLSPDEERSVKQILSWLLSTDLKVAVIDGLLDQRKEAVLGHLRDLVQWDLNDLFKLSVIRIKQGPSANVVEKLSSQFAPDPAAIVPAYSNMLIILDPPMDASSNFPAAAWTESVCQAVKHGNRILLTFRPENGSLIFGNLERIEWISGQAKGPAVTFGLTSTVDAVEDEACEILESTVFGLTSEELFQVMSEGDEEQKYAVISRFMKGEVSDIAGSEGRWISKIGAIPAPSDLANRLSQVLSRSVDAAIRAVRDEDWKALRSLVPSALEGLIQHARVDDPDAAFRSFREYVYEPVLYRFARFDLLLSTLSCFFVDETFSKSILKSPDLVTAARLATAQVLANLGRVRDAAALYKPIIAGDISIQIPHDSHVLVAAAFCHYTAGSYLMAEKLLKRVVDAGERTNRSSVGLPEDHSAVAHRSLGKIYIREGRLEEAEQHLILARKLYEELNDVQGLCGVDAYDADLTTARGNFDAALQFVIDGIKRADELYGQLRRIDARDRVRLLLAKARTLTIAGRYKESQLAADEAMRAALITGAQDFIIDASIILALAHQNNDGVVTHLSTLAQMFRITEQYGLQRHKAEVLLAIATIEMTAGNRKRGRRLAKDAFQLAELDGFPHSDALIQRAARMLLDK